jgi:hypothetical protein
MSGTVLASGLFLTISAMIQTTISIFSQKLIFLWHSVLLQTMTAI